MEDLSEDERKPRKIAQRTGGSGGNSEAVARLTVGADDNATALLGWLDGFFRFQVVLVFKGLGFGKIGKPLVCRNVMCVEMCETEFGCWRVRSYMCMP